MLLPNRSSASSMWWSGSKTGLLHGVAFGEDDSGGGELIPGTDPPAEHPGDGSTISSGHSGDQVPGNQTGAAYLPLRCDPGDDAGERRVRGGGENDQQRGVPVVVTGEQPRDTLRIAGSHAPGQAGRDRRSTLNPALRLQHLPPERVV